MATSAATSTSSTSSFLTPGRVAKEGALTSLYVRRDTSIPVVLSQTVSSSQDQGYAEGVVTNTRFGSFPHSTIIDSPWGSQIRASQVDTGSRGRLGPDQQAKRRKLNETNGVDKEAHDDGVRDAVAASSGFVHVLPPTPESWTYSLPHRTQVVYTPDYSYILLRIRARPGSQLIESGSGSGSFTHAAARAVFNGSDGHGHVFTYEYHEARHAKLKTELDAHGLSSVVTATHRDVYKDGFLLPDGTSPRASSVFLDLPAPWRAFEHLQRTPSDGSISALEPTQTVYLCTFLPCIEQVQKSVAQLRRYGWQELSVVEIAHKRIDVRRDYTGYRFDGMRGVNAVAADVDEALDKLREVEQRTRDFQTGPAGEDAPPKKVKEVRISNKQQDASKAFFRQGSLIHHPESELKTHTSYLVFAVLPRDWTEEDEARERENWGKFVKVDVDVPKITLVS
ncbi:hypothetical protein DV735_g4458, partial [Chaetothyriales sp. CBS 134920]